MEAAQPDAAQDELRRQWLLERSRGLGGTDIAQIILAEVGDEEKVGCYEHSLLEIWAVKSPNGKPPPVDPNEVSRSSKEMARGLAMEDYISRQYQIEAELEGINPINPGITWHETRPLIFGTGDRLFMSNPVRGFEAKSRRSYKGWGPSGTDQIPLDVEIQVRVYMEVYGLDRWDVGAAFGLDDLRFYALGRDRDFGNRILDMAELWWNRFVVGEVPPEPGWGGDCRRVLERLHRTPRPVLRPPEDDDILLHKQVVAARKVWKRAEKMKSLHENRLRKSIGDDTGIDGVATWKAIERQGRFDMERFKKDYPDLYQEYVLPAETHRRLHIIGDRS